MSEPLNYVSDVAYIASFRRELAPEWLRFVATIDGMDIPPPPPPMSPAGQRWCELGCGQGITSTIVAATHPGVQCVAIDAMPQHIHAARALAGAAGVTNIDFHALDFAAALALATREDWPRFDCIVAHGVYSWVDANVRSQMRQFIERFLAPGGLVYLSYNALPGWTPDLPFQHLVHALAEREAGDSNARFAKAMRTVLALRDAGVPALRASPTLTHWERDLHLRPASYYPHEYLAPAWQPRYVDDVRRELAAIGLVPAGSATVCENFDDFVLPRSARAALAGINDVDARELARDHFMSQRFRQDVFVRGAARLPDAERRTRLLGFRVALLCPPEHVAFEMSTQAGKVRFDNPVARQLVAALANGPARARDLADATVPEQDVLANLLALCSAGVVQPVPETDAAHDALNAALLDHLPADEANFHVLRCGTAVRLPRAMLRARAGALAPVGADPWAAFLARFG